MKNRYTSLELSKKLKENGCELESDKVYIDQKSKIFRYKIAQAYDILYDICVKYAKKFFAEEKVCINCKIVDKFKICKKCTQGFYIPTKQILEMLQQKKPKEEIENFIWQNCRFNPKNKEDKWKKIG